MRIVVHPQRGYYRLFFLDGGALTSVGQVDLVATTKGYRPKDYLVRKPGSRHGRSLPTKDLIASLRQAEVRVTRPERSGRHSSPISRSPGSSSPSAVPASSRTG